MDWQNVCYNNGGIVKARAYVEIYVARIYFIGYSFYIFQKAKTEY